MSDRPDEANKASDAPPARAPPTLASRTPSTLAGMPGADVPVPAVDASASRYELRDALATGGMGAVYAARDHALARDVAVKVLREDLRADTGIGRRFVEEARITGQLQHPGLPRVHDLGTLPDGRPFIAMKLINGRTLASLLRERPDRRASCRIFCRSSSRFARRLPTRKPGRNCQPGRLRRSP